MVRRILGIKWEQVIEDKITNKEVLARFNNIPEINIFIVRRTNTYIVKVIRAKKTNLPRKLLGVWIYYPRKIGCPPNSCNNNFLIAINSIIPGVGKNAKFQDWAPLAGDESLWNSKINIFFADLMTLIPDENMTNAEPKIR